MSTPVGISFFVLILMFRSCVVATRGFCKQVTPGLPDFTAEWLDMQPYMYSTTPSEARGVLYELLLLLNKTLPISIKLGRHFNINQLQEFKNASQSSPSDNNSLILLPVTKIKNDNDDACVIGAYYTKGSAYIVKRNVKKPLTQLGNSFINGGQIIAITLILSVISGVVIWILDRHKNPEDFPASFIIGSWQGFWWAFVTMTTVGYGDTAPKSVPARLYSILWMLLGMVSFSILTANITSSLTYEIESDLNLYGKVVAVLNESLERQAAVAYGAGFLEYPNISAMVDALKQGDVNAMLLEMHTTSAAQQIHFKYDNLEIGRTVDYGYYLAMQLHRTSQNACAAISKCVKELVDGEEFQSKSLKLLSDQVKLDKEAKATNNLFDDPSFFIILISLFSAMIVGGLLWEYFYYKPKMLRLTQTCAANDIEMTEGKGGVDKAVLLSSEVDELCYGCKKIVNSIMANEGIQRIESLRANSFNPLDGFSIIGNQLNAIPGMASIRKSSKKKRRDGKAPS